MGESDILTALEITMAATIVLDFHKAFEVVFFF